MCVCVRACVCVCACVYIYAFVFVCIEMCVHWYLYPSLDTMPDKGKSEAPRGTLSTHLLHCQSLLFTCLDLPVPHRRCLRASAKKQKAEGTVYNV